MDMFTIFYFRYHFTVRHALVFIALSWIASFGITFYGSFPGLFNAPPYVVALQSSKLLCLNNFADQHLDSIVLNTVTVAVILSAMLALVIAYGYIFWLYHSAKLKERAILEEDNTTSQTSNQSRFLSFSEMSEGEKKLFFRSASVVGSMVVLWFPYQISIVYQISTGLDVSPILDGLFTLLVALFYPLNALLIAYFDPILRKGTLELLPFKAFKNKSTSALLQQQELSLNHSVSFHSAFANAVLPNFGGITSLASAFASNDALPNFGGISSLAFRANDSMPTDREI